MKTIGVIGLGFVGNAVFEGMRHAFGIYGYDAKQPDKLRVAIPGEQDQYLTIEDPLRFILGVVDGPIFVAVPTPMKADGCCDTSIVESVVLKLDSMASADQVVIIKSTVPPGTTEAINEKCKNILACFNPEFLTEAAAVQDFKNQDRIIIGGPHKGTQVAKLAYQIAYPRVPTTKTSSTIAEMVKYVTNCFLATKVSFANEIKQICDSLGIDYDKVVEYATKDKRLGASHWSVPGKDGLAGWGGKCFPKDLNALAFLGKQLGVQTMILDAVWQQNLSVRHERDWEKIEGVISKLK